MHTWPAKTADRHSDLPRDSGNGLLLRGQDASHRASAPEQFAHLLEALRHHSGERVAVLIDEYDEPMLDTLEEPEVARANHDFLRNFYEVIKNADAHVRFSFITGITKFSKVSLFSGINDPTVPVAGETLCGQVPGQRVADPSDHGGFQPRGAKRDDVPRGRRVRPRGNGPLNAVGIRIEALDALRSTKMKQPTKGIKPWPNNQVTFQTKT